jgi:hypothetical protein
VSDQFTRPHTTAKYKSGLMDICPPICKKGVAFTCTTEGSIRLDGQLGSWSLCSGTPFLLDDGDCLYLDEEPRVYEGGDLDH